MRRSLLWMAALASCSLTHSLDDLKGGTAGEGSGATGGTNAGGGAGESTSGGEPGMAGNPSGGDVGAAGEAGGGGATPSGLQVEVLNFRDAPTSQLGFLESIEVQFSHDMDSETLTTTDTVFCDGSIQLQNAEGDCLLIEVTGADNDFTITPLEPLTVNANYTLFVTEAAQSLSGETLDEQRSFPFTAIYRHTITIDGTNDFVAGEEFSTTTTGYTAYIAWDDDALYLGMEGPDIDGSVTDTFLTAHLGPLPESGALTEVGQGYNNQIPNLHFQANRHFRWKTTDLLCDVREYEASAWQPGADVSADDRHRTDQYFEVRLPFDVLGNPGTGFKLVMGIVHETDTEWTYAGVPDDAFDDGFNPEYVTRLEFDFDGTQLPAADY
jgi:hypothetical protein